MTTATDFMTNDAATSVPVRIADGGRMVIRAVQRLSGVALIIAAMALWFAPGAAWESDVMLFKLILSLTAGLAGVGLMQSSTRPNTPEIEIDTIRREVRLVRRLKGGVSAVLHRCAFAELGRAERDGAHVRMWDANKVFLAEVSLGDRTEMNSLMAGLRAAGKVA